MTAQTLPNSATADNLSITTALARAEDHTYRPPPAPNEQDYLPLTLVAEIMYHGLPQRMDHVSISKTTEWPDVRACLERSREGSWQVRMLEGEQAEREEEAVGHGAERMEKGWLYQYVVKGVPGKDFLPLKSGKQWEKLRERMMREGVDMVIWPEILYAEMLRRKAWLREAEAEDMVDLHNACEMDVPGSLGIAPAGRGTVETCGNATVM